MSQLLNLKEGLSSIGFETPNKQSTPSLLEIGKQVQFKIKPKRTQNTYMKYLLEDFKDALRHLENRT